MQSSSHPVTERARSHSVTERARPLLGTLVSVRVADLSPSEATYAIENAFSAIQDVHHRMSFHRFGSELSCLNRTAHLRPVPVSSGLWTVLACAQHLSAETDGLFDVTVTPSLVKSGLLPTPPDFGIPCGTWRDIQLCPDRTVSFTKPLSIDLGGIAKGYAVDCAAKALLAAGVSSAVINAGGDLRVLGPTPERIALRIKLEPAAKFVPVLELSEGSVAGSCTTDTVGVHIHGRNRKPLPPGTFVSVVAESCMVADGLTKFVLAGPAQSARTLRRFSAEAFVHQATGEWSHWA